MNPKLKTFIAVAPLLFPLWIASTPLASAVPIPSGSSPADDLIINFDQE